MKHHLIWLQHPLPSEILPTTSTTTLTGTLSNSNNDLLYIKCPVTLAGLNKLATKSTNPDIAKLDTIFYTMFNSN